MSQIQASEENSESSQAYKIVLVKIVDDLKLIIDTIMQII